MDIKNNNKTTVKIMDMEKNNFSGNSIRKSILGDVKGYYNGKRFNFNDIDCDSDYKKRKEIIIYMFLYC